VNYTVVISRHAQRSLASLPIDIRNRIYLILLALESNPRPHGCKKLADLNGWRLRIGQYRALYTVDDAQRLVVVYEVGHRREVYR
jgi:mRNA interferase RelE/StbE